MNFAGLDGQEVQEQFLFASEGFQVEAQGGNVSSHFLGSLFKSEEHARFPEFLDSSHEELQSEHRFAAAGTAADDRGAATRQATSADFVQALNARGSFI